MLATMTGLSREELATLRKLTTPRKIQDFLDTIPAAFGETCRSPRMVLRERRALCIEGAMLAAAALRLHGYPPLLMDLKSIMRDDDHVVAVYKKDGCWGAISKTNHGVLRYREPVYRSPRELAMSFFHEYFLDDGRKTLRSFSSPLDLSRFDKKGWMTDEKDLWYIAEYVDLARHHPLLTKSQIAGLRPADKIEREMGRLIQWPRPR